MSSIFGNSLSENRRPTIWNWFSRTIKQSKTKQNKTNGCLRTNRLRPAYFLMHLLNIYHLNMTTLWHKNGHFAYTNNGNFNPITILRSARIWKTNEKENISRIACPPARPCQNFPGHLSPRLVFHCELSLFLSTFCYLPQSHCTITRT